MPPSAGLGRLKVGNDASGKKLRKIPNGCLFTGLHPSREAQRARRDEPGSIWTLRLQLSVALAGAQRFLLTAQSTLGCVQLPFLGLSNPLGQHRIADPRHGLAA